MSKQDLVDAYLDGRISRRTLVRRLTALGVSAATAVGYAGALEPEFARAGVVGDDLYPLLSLSILSRDIGVVRANGTVRLRGSSGEELKALDVNVFIKKGKGLRKLGTASIAPFLTAAGEREFLVPVNVSQLAGKRRAKIVAWAQGSDSEDYPAVASTSVTTLR